MEFTDEQILGWFLNQVSLRLDLSKSNINGDKLAYDAECLQMLIYDPKIFARLANIVNEKISLLANNNEGNNEGPGFKFTASFNFKGVYVHTYADSKKEFIYE